MVKRCSWGTCKTDSRYPERLQTEDGKIISFHSFPSVKKFKEREKHGLGHAVEVIHSNVKRTAIYYNIVSYLLE